MGGRDSSDAEFGREKLTVAPRENLEDVRGFIVRNDLDITVRESPEFAYSDNFGRLRKSALLISRDGDGFIKANRGMLSNLARGLSEIEYIPDDSANRDRHKTRVDLGNDRKLEFLTQGGQSLVFILTIGEKKFIVKRYKEEIREKNLVSQPYVDEMLQMAMVRRDLGAQLETLEVETPRVLFATGQMMCTEFVDGSTPRPEDVESKIKAIEKIVAPYVNEKRRSEPSVWAGIETDLIGGWFGIRNKNFIRRPNGRLVCIDMFKFAGDRI